MIDESGFEARRIGYSILVFAACCLPAVAFAQAQTSAASSDAHGATTTSDTRATASSAVSVPDGKDSTTVAQAAKPNPPQSKGAYAGSRFSKDLVSSYF